MKFHRRQRGQATLETVILAVVTLSLLAAGTWGLKLALNRWLLTESTAFAAPAP